MHKLSIRTHTREREVHTLPNTSNNIFIMKSQKRTVLMTIEMIG